MSALIFLPGKTEETLADSCVEISKSLSYICFTGSRPVSDAC